MAGPQVFPQGPQSALGRARPYLFTLFLPIVILAVGSLVEVNLVATKRIVKTRNEAGEEVETEGLLDLPMAHAIIRDGDILVLVGSTASVSNLPS